MIWFNINELEHKITKNELSDKDGLNYVLAFFIMTTIAMSIGSNNDNGWIGFLDCLVSVLITVWGLNAAYKANNDIDGKDFFKRFFAISWVIGMRLLIIALIGSVVLKIIIVASHINYMDRKPIDEFFVMIFMSLISVIYYLLVLNSFRRLNPITE